MAEEATKNPRPRGQTRVRTSARTFHNPASWCWVALLHQMRLGGFPNQNLQGGPGRLKEGTNLAARTIWPELATSFSTGRQPTFWFSNAPKCKCTFLWLREPMAFMVMEIGSADV